MSRGARLIDFVRQPSPPLVLGMAAVLLGCDRLLSGLGEASGLGGPLDVTAHLLTGTLVLAALPGRTSRSFAVGLVSGAVLIDLDHAPGALGVQILSRGTDRPYTHSLATLAVLALATVLWRSRRPLLWGGVIGLGVHFARDLTESGSGVALLWPWSYDSLTLPHWTYLTGMLLVLGVALVRARPGRRRRSGALEGAASAA